MDQYYALELFLRRCPLVEEHAQLVRLRVAIAVYRRIAIRLERKFHSKDVPGIIENFLNNRTLHNQTHMLDEELRDLISFEERGKSHMWAYVEQRKLSAKRTIRYVRYGGRRDQTN